VARKGKKPVAVMMGSRLPSVGRELHGFVAIYIKKENPLRGQTLFARGGKRRKDKRKRMEGGKRTRDAARRFIEPSGNPVTTERKEFARLGN